MRRFMLGLAAVCAAALAQSASAQGVGGGLVGFYVYPHQNGVIINSFIPQSSAWQLSQQGQLFSGDVVTRYNGQPVRSAWDIRQISSQSPPGQWLRMDFVTSTGQPFWLWVQPGGGAVAAAAPGAPAQQQPYRMKVGSGRPGAGQPGTKPGNPAPPPDNSGGPGRPNAGGGSGGPGRPQ